MNYPAAEQRGINKTLNAPKGGELNSERLRKKANPEQLDNRKKWKNVANLMNSFIDIDSEKEVKS